MTLRETYIEGLMDAMKAFAGFPAGVERSISIAYTREESPVLVVHRGEETLENSMGDDTDRQCEILVSVISRGDTPEVDADDVMDVAHPLIMQYQGAGILQVEELGTKAPLYSNTDGMACMVTARYRIQYSTSRLSLSA
jgi:hypothetical protein